MSCCNGECPCHTTQNKHYWFLQAGEIIECGHCHPVKWAINQDRQCDCKCHTQNKWEERFDELAAALFETATKNTFWDAIQLGKEMTREALASQRETLAVEIERMKDGFACYECGSEGYDAGIADAAAHIRKQ